jgi:ribosomal protein L16/L10AE
VLAKRPKFFKYKRPFNKKIKKNNKARSKFSAKIVYGSFGIKALETCKLQYHHVEAMRRVLTRVCKFNTKI